MTPVQSPSLALQASATAVAQANGLAARPDVYLRLTGEPAWRRLAAGALAWQALAVKDALLLARLALNGPQMRTTLAAWLWPTAAPPRANANLRQRLFRLRLLEAALVLEDGPRLQLAPGVMAEGLVPCAAEDFGADESPMSFDPAKPLLAGIDALLQDSLQIEWLDHTRREWATAARWAWEAAVKMARLSSFKTCSQCAR